MGIKYSCPKCQCEDVLVQVTTFMKLTQFENGEWETSDDGDHEWGDESQMICSSCTHQDKGAAFIRPDFEREERETIEATEIEREIDSPGQQAADEQAEQEACDRAAGRA